MLVPTNQNGFDLGRQEELGVSGDILLLNPPPFKDRNMNGGGFNNRWNPSKIDLFLDQLLMLFSAAGEIFWAPAGPQTQKTHAFSVFPLEN